MTELNKNTKKPFVYFPENFKSLQMLNLAKDMDLEQENIPKSRF